MTLRGEPYRSLANRVAGIAPLTKELLTTFEADDIALHGVPESAVQIDPKALEGSAYTSLGSLYYQVPGWPLGFGDNKKALDLLRKGLALNPNGIDPNYFYGDYLYRSGDYGGAEQALLKALQAPPREGRKLADEGRRREINELLQKVREKKP